MTFISIKKKLKLITKSISAFHVLEMLKLSQIKVKILNSQNKNTIGNPQNFWTSK